MDAGIKWCGDNNYTFIWIHENNMLDYIDENNNKDIRNEPFYLKTKKGIHEPIKNSINKEK